MKKAVGKREKEERQQGREGTLEAAEDLGHLKTMHKNIKGDHILNREGGGTWVKGMREARLEGAESGPV